MHTYCTCYEYCSNIIIGKQKTREERFFFNLHVFFGFITLLSLRFTIPKKHRLYVDCCGRCIAKKTMLTEFCAAVTGMYNCWPSLSGRMTVANPSGNKSDRATMCTHTQLYLGTKCLKRIFCVLLTHLTRDQFGMPCCCLQL